MLEPAETDVQCCLQFPRKPRPHLESGSFRHICDNFQYFVFFYFQINIWFQMFSIKHVHVTKPQISKAGSPTKLSFVQSNWINSELTENLSKYAHTVVCAQKCQGQNFMRILGPATYCVDVIAHWVYIWLYAWHTLCMRSVWLLKRTTFFFC
jgi:hypothetical protein